VESKISPAFEQILAGCGPDEERDAIIIFSAPTTEAEKISSRLDVLEKRLDYIKASAKRQGHVQSKVISDYKKASRKYLSGGRKSNEFQIRSIGGNTLPVVAAQVTSKTLAHLADQKHVVAVIPNQRIHLIKPKQIGYSDLGKHEKKDGVTWGLKALEIKEFWNRTGTRGKGINVAVLDTGVYGEHQCLKGRVKAFAIIDPLGRRIETKPTFDCGAHGTHVCGTIAGGSTPDGVSVGVAPEASLLVAGVLVGDATLETLIQGIAWAVENGANIINMSLGFSYYEPLFSQIFNMLIEQYGILPVVAIGNENHGNSSSPGNAYNALSVGALEKGLRGKFNVPFFSSGASLVFPGTSHDAITKPDVVAPGVQVYSAVPPEKTSQGTFEYSYMDGTSMATPHVAGVAALLMAAKPQAPVSAIMDVLKETAIHPGGNNVRPDNRWGYGRICPLEAIKALA
jgi:subtilisin family serine protease